MSTFAYLRAHSYYSSLGGPASPEAWCQRASELGHKALGLAERAPLAALPEFARAARQAGIVPLCGVELDLLPPGGKEGPRSALLFAIDADCLHDLAALAGQAYAGWPRSSQPLSWEALAARSEGLVLVLLGTANGLGEWAEAAKPVFGERAFVGLPGPGPAPDLVRAASQARLRAVAAPPAFYLGEEDALSHRALRLARERAGWTLPEDIPFEDAHLLSPEEAAKQLEEWPEALDNVERIVEMCAGAADGFTWPTGPDESTIAALRARAEEALPRVLMAEEVPAEARERLDAELSWIERSGQAPTWAGLASLAEAAGLSGTPLGAPLGSADGSLVAAALGVSSNPLACARPPWLGDEGDPLPPGVEVPATRYHDLISALAAGGKGPSIAFAACSLDISPPAAVAASGGALGLTEERIAPLREVVDEGWEALSKLASGSGPEAQVARLALTLRGAPVLFKSDPDTPVVDTGAWSLAPILALEGSDLPTWIPWTRHALRDLRCPVLWLERVRALSALDAGLRLAREYPADGFAPGDLSTYPLPHEKAFSFLKKGQLVGIPYLSGKVLKGWKGDLGPEAVAALVARSHWQKERPKGPDGVAAWVDATAETGGSLLYYDQFASVVEAAGGISPQGAAALRLAMLNPKTDPDGALRARFVAGCLASGIDAEVAGKLYTALSAAAPGLVSRYVAQARARVALWSAQLKAGHPAAFLVAHIDLAWQRGGRPAVLPFVDEARHLGVSLLPPDVARSLPAPTPEKANDGWAVRWGLALLPGWDHASAARFVEARSNYDISTLPGLLAAATEAGITAPQLEALVRAGACDALGGREDLLEALADSENAAQPGPATAASPRTRYARRKWEEEQTGVGFTPAGEMEWLEKALGSGGDVLSRMITTRQIGPGQVGQSVYLVGLLHGITLAENPKGADSEAEFVAVGWLEDLDGEIELVAFPPNYRRHKELWTENNALVVTARVVAHPDGDGVYLLCEHLAAYNAQVDEATINVKVRVSRKSETAPLPPPEVHPGNGGSRAPAHAASAPAHVAVEAPKQMPALQEIEVPTGGAPRYHLIISLPVSTDDRADIDRMIALDKLLRSHPGPDTVTLRIPYSPETGAVTSAQLPRGVNYTSALEIDIRDLLGPEALALIKLLG